MIRLTRKYQFAASHRLHSDQLSPEENRETFGKCNNPFGHGHNYQLEVSVRGEIDSTSGRAIDITAFDRVVNDHVLLPMHHANLNTDIEEFAALVPTSENLGRVVDRRLREAWQSAFPRGPELDGIRIYETERSIIELAGAR